jgi:hypothetical protein
MADPVSSTRLDVSIPILQRIAALCATIRRSVTHRDEGGGNRATTVREALQAPVRLCKGRVCGVSGAKVRLSVDP